MLRTIPLTVTIDGLNLIIIICGIIAVAIALKQKFRKNNYESNTYAEDEFTKEQIDYSKCYQPRYLLTKNEYREYKKLKEEAAKRNLIICPKVRLLDLVEPRKNLYYSKQLLWKIQAKHVDFVICDKNMYVQAVLEIDDGSHASIERQERDQFINIVLDSCGYKVIRTFSINEHTLDGLGDIENRNNTYNQYSM